MVLIMRPAATSRPHEKASCHHDQHLADAPKTQARRPARFVVEDLAHVALRGAERRDGASQNCAQDRQRKDKGDDGGIEAHHEPQRQLLARRGGVEEINADLRHEQAGRRPATASTSVSASSCKMVRRRPAPSAVLIAISLVRRAVRASSRFATFAHAIRSTPNTAPSISSNIDLRLGTDEEVGLSHDRHPDAVVRFGMIGGDPPGDEGHLGLGRFERDTVLEPRQGLELRALERRAGSARERERVDA